MSFKQHCGVFWGTFDAEVVISLGVPELLRLRAVRVTWSLCYRPSDHCYRGYTEHQTWATDLSYAVQMHLGLCPGGSSDLCYRQPGLQLCLLRGTWPYVVCLSVLSSPDPHFLIHLPRLTSDLRHEFTLNIYPDGWWIPSPAWPFLGPIGLCLVAEGVVWSGPGLSFLMKRLLLLPR